MLLFLVKPYTIEIDILGTIYCQILQQDSQNLFIFVSQIEILTRSHGLDKDNYPYRPYL